MFSSASKPKTSSNSTDRSRSTPSTKFSNEPELSTSTPSLREMITRAVADLRESHGSTAKSIYEYVSTKFTSTPTKVNQELEKSVEAGLLIADPAFYSGNKNSPNRNRLFMPSPKNQTSSLLSPSNHIQVNNNKSPRTMKISVSPQSSSKLSKKPKTRQSKN